MTLCAMYNISIAGSHPTTICVVMERFLESFNELYDIIDEDDPDVMMDFISRYARTDEIMPDDKTVGFVVINAQKKLMSVSFSDIDENMKRIIRSTAEKFKNKGFKVEADL
ncbi:hypothetical protein DMB44_05795 [Thermoplasma sp. Kam2015]|uniref:TA0956 family protein n=1 Tax=Thermoplasma sp. Kam2015 TaxID=2094122 RepID=UPI000D8CF019|nr:TA0956 family protein [Thermoplasma sp. Kam2015]PYB68014.1 hypothetical protein DMB44_05795 [Thermoplasma sp. Kam2015]